MFKRMLSKAICTVKNVNTLKPLKLNTIKVINRNNTTLIDPQEKVGIYDLDLSSDIRKILERRGFSELFPIQYKCFDPILQGQDLLGRARTGTGKTIAFALPVVEKLAKNAIGSRFRYPSCLVLTPTRELAIQVKEEFVTLAGNRLKCINVYGGSSYSIAENELRRGVDIVIGTPGRVQDMANRGTLNLKEIKVLIFDEADHMLDIGFKADMDNIIRFIKESGNNVFQFLLFSATVPKWVEEAINKYLKPGYIKVDLVGNEVIKASTTVSHVAIPCTKQDFIKVLPDIIKFNSLQPKAKIILFTETKREADEVANELSMSGITSQALHGDVTQNRREFILNSFKKHRFQCIVATDVASRGIDIPNVEMVINLGHPKNSETYIHRSGRTGRAGKSGVCITLFDLNECSTLAETENDAGFKYRLKGTYYSEFETFNKVRARSLFDGNSFFVTVSSSTITQDELRRSIPDYELNIKNVNFLSCPNDGTKKLYFDVSASFLTQSKDIVPDVEIVREMPQIGISALFRPFIHSNSNNKSRNNQFSNRFGRNASFNNRTNGGFSQRNNPSPSFFGNSNNDRNNFSRSSSNNNRGNFSRFNSFSNDRKGPNNSGSRNDPFKRQNGTGQSKFGGPGFRSYSSKIRFNFDKVDLFYSKSLVDSILIR